MPSAKAGRVAATHVTGKSGSKKSKKPNTKEKEGSKIEEVVPSKVYAGGKKSGKFKPPGKLSKEERNKIKRHGKGARSFKSKAKHKRR